MKRYRRAILCAAALCMMASGLARGADGDGLTLNQPLEASPSQPVALPPLEVAGPSQQVAGLPQQVAGPPLPSPVFDAAPPPAGVPVSVFVPNQTPGWEFNAGVLLLRPGADNLGFATITTFLPLQNPQWAVQTLNPSYQPGFNVGARYALASPGKDIRVNWDHLRTVDSSSVAVSDPNTQWISPFSQTGPSMSESANQVGIFHFKSAYGQSAFDYDMVNIDFSQTVNIGQKTQVRLFTGLAYVRLREQLISTFYNDPNINPVLPVVAITDPTLKYITLNNTSTFNGLGPRLGANTTCNVFRRFTLVGQLSGAVLAGWMQPAQYQFSGVFNNATDSEQIASKTVSQVVWAGDAKLGAGYSRPLFNGSVLTIESGFRAAVFINAFSTYETSTNVLPLDLGSLSTSSMRHTPSNFTLNGFYGTCSLRW